MKRQTYNSSLFYWKDDILINRSQYLYGSQNILSISKKPVDLTETIVGWQPKGLSNEELRPPTTSNNDFSPKLKRYNSKVRVNFNPIQDW